MHWSITIGRVAGTAIRLHVTFILFLVWIAISDYKTGGYDAASSSVVFLVLVFACVVAHEFGHILMARYFGIKTPQVTLLPIGGIANMERIPEDPWQELSVAVAGPMVNVVIAAVLIMIGGFAVADVQDPDFANVPLMQRLALVNISLVVFNLIPAFPMDGGRVLRAVLAMRLNPQRATEIAARLGQAFALLFVALGLFFNPLLIFIGLFIFLAGISELQASAVHRFAQGLTVSDGMERSVQCMRSDASLSDAVDLLLATSQKNFPVVDAKGIPVGMLDRNDLADILKTSGPETKVSAVMRAPATVPATVPLDDAINHMSQTRNAPEIVVDGKGRIMGMLTMENIAEMMMIHSMRPEWNFHKRGT
jgi:Zn-dependent protease/CBS domain-containing protein